MNYFDDIGLEFVVPNKEDEFFSSKKDSLLQKLRKQNRFKQRRSPNLL